MLHRRHLITRNSCDHPLTSDDINHDHFCAPIHKCIHCQHWFYPVLIFGIIAILIATCCTVKALRPKPWKRGVDSFKRGLGYDKPVRIDRKGTSERGRGSGIPPDRAWPGIEMGGTGREPSRGERGVPSVPFDPVQVPTRPHRADREGG
ncbi:MAG: hypothetical protein Q9216_003566 [Gyalolechia sp. 2 TL-2023]